MNVSTKFQKFRSASLRVLAKIKFPGLACQIYIPRSFWRLSIFVILLIAIITFVPEKETSAYGGLSVHAPMIVKAYVGYPQADWSMIYPGSEYWMVGYSIYHGEYDEDDVDVVWGCDHQQGPTPADVCTTFNHFWSPDHDLWTRVEDYIVDCPESCRYNSLVKSISLTGLSLGWYVYGNDRVLGNELLGRVAHLLQDQSVPAHVHNDLHPPGAGNDHYEDEMNNPAYHDIYMWDGDVGVVYPPGMTTAVGLIDIPSDVCQKMASDSAFKYIWSMQYFPAFAINPALNNKTCPTCGPMEYADGMAVDPCSNTYGQGLAKIAYLMYTTNQYADWFDSYNNMGVTDGYGNSIVTYFPEWIDYSEFVRVFGADRDPYFVLQGHYLYRYAMRATATLLKVYEEMTKPTLLVNSLNEPGVGECDTMECTLREAISMAAPGATIQFAPDLSGQTITLQNTLVINKNLIIDGTSLASPPVISGSDSMGVFSVNAGVTATLKGLNIVHGKAANGGGIYNAGTVTVSDSTLSENNAFSTGCGGGAINNFGLLAMLTVTNTTFSANSASAETCGGGAISNYLGAVTVTNSTFSGNSATWAGGGIFNLNGSLTVTNCTFSGNHANQTGSSIYNHDLGSVNLRNSILANSPSIAECVGTLASNINNLIEDGSCSPSLSGDPLLGPLQGNGGPTPTMAIGITSPAYNAGENSVCPATDQRGKPRPVAAQCDIGAFEYGNWIYLPKVQK